MISGALNSEPNSVRAVYREDLNSSTNVPVLRTKTVNPIKYYMKDFVTFPID